MAKYTNYMCAIIHAAPDIKSMADFQLSSVINIFMNLVLIYCFL